MRDSVIVPFWSSDFGLWFSLLALWFLESCSTSRRAAEYGSQGQVPIHRDATPGYLLDKIPRPEGAQYSVARFAGSVNSGGT